MKNKIVYEHGTRTLRQKPGNYCIAMREGCSWRMCPDLAADTQIVTTVANVLMSYVAKYSSGHELLEHIQNFMNATDSLSVNERSIEVIFGKGCGCEETTDEVSRTLDEVLEEIPTCPTCLERFRPVSTLLHKSFNFTVGEVNKD